MPHKHKCGLADLTILASQMYADVFQTSMNAYPMEDWVHVHRYVPTPLDHSSAVVYLDTLCLAIPAMVR